MRLVNEIHRRKALRSLGDCENVLSNGEALILSRRARMRKVMIVRTREAVFSRGRTGFRIIRSFSARRTERFGLAFAEIPSIARNAVLFACVAVNAMPDGTSRYQSFYSVALEGNTMVRPEVGNGPMKVVSVEACTIRFT